MAPGELWRSADAPVPVCGARCVAAGPDRRLVADQEVIELEGVIEELGGELTPDQARKVLAVHRKYKHGGSETDEREGAFQREAVLRRFRESPHAKGIPDVDGAWI